MGNALQLVVDEELHERFYCIFQAQLFTRAHSYCQGGQQYLRCHHNEAKGEEETVTAAKNEAVPPLVLVVDHTAMRWITRYVQNRGSLGAKAPVNAVADGQREESHAQVLECHPREQKLRKL